MPTFAAIFGSKSKCKLTFSLTLSPLLKRCLFGSGAQRNDFRDDIEALEKRCFAESELENASEDSIGVKSVIEFLR